MVPVALPEDPILVGATIYWQALAADGGLTPHPFASSDGIAMTIGDALTHDDQGVDQPCPPWSRARHGGASR